MNLLKLLWWDLRSRPRRFEYVHWLVKDLPGLFGEEIRRRLYRRRFKRCGPGLRVFPGVRFRNLQNIELGSHCHLGNDSFLEGAGGIALGDHVQLGPGVKIWTIHHTRNDTTKTMLDQEPEFRPVRIGSNVWLAANVFVMPGAEIGDWCVVSAGSVVAGSSIPPYTLLAGNPARRCPRGPTYEKDQSTPPAETDQDPEASR